MTYALKAIQDSGGLLTGDVDGMKLGYYAGKYIGGPKDGGSCACCLPVINEKGGEYRHNGHEWIWHRD